MKKVFYFKLQSYTDVITNSSSELFIIKENCDDIKSFLDGIIQTYNEENNTNIPFVHVYTLFNEKNYADFELYDYYGIDLNDACNSNIELPVFEYHMSYGRISRDLKKRNNYVFDEIFLQNIKDLYNEYNSKYSESIKKFILGQPYEEPTDVGYSLYDIHRFMLGYNYAKSMTEFLDPKNVIGMCSFVYDGCAYPMEFKEYFKKTLNGNIIFMG